MNFQPYIFDPLGDGVRYPIKQARAVTPSGLLPPNVAAKLWSRRRAAPNVFSSAIHKESGAGVIKPSYFSQVGRGRENTQGYQRRPTPIVRWARYDPKYGGRISSSSFKGGKILKVFSSGPNTKIVRRINPGSF